MGIFRFDEGERTISSPVVLSYEELIFKFVIFFIKRCSWSYENGQLNSQFKLETSLTVFTNCEILI